ncbi:MAG: hypothetical protein N2316_09710 [Spirochaetes bacterium]|nr:hypothetical protein [Spirochaetota bacterium]
MPKRSWNKAILCIICISFASEIAASMLYTTVSGGVSQRRSFGDEVAFERGFLSPIIESGARIDREQWMGFYVRFLIDPHNTNHVSSYYLLVKWNYFYIERLLYFGVSGGMHIESDAAEEESTTTVSSDEAQILINGAMHAGISFEITLHHYIVCEAFASYSIGRYKQLSANASIGLMTLF